MNEEMDNLKKRQISRFERVDRRNTNKPTTIGAFIKAIGDGTFAAVMDDIRKTGDKEARGRKKRELLPAVMISGLKGGKDGSGFLHSGVLQMDFDDEEDPEKCKSLLMSDPYVCCAFISPSGTGVKALVPIDGDFHKECFERAKNHFKDSYGLIADESPKSPESLCYFSHDPDIYVSERSASVVQWGGAAWGLFSDSTAETKDTAVAISTSTDYITPGQGNPQAEKVRIHNECEARKERILDECPEDLRHLWENYFEKYYHPDFARRNSIAIEMVTNLYNKIGEESLVELASLFHEIYRPMFNDPKKTHLYEVTSHIEAMEASFEELLEPTELEFYKEFTPLQRDAFRICRDLAAWTEAEVAPPPLFWMSYHDLGVRIGLRGQEASRLMRFFLDLDILKIEKKGIRRARGRRSRATTWKWQLSLKEVEDAPK